MSKRVSVSQDLERGELLAGHGFRIVCSFAGQYRVRTVGQAEGEPLALLRDNLVNGTGDGRMELPLLLRLRHARVLDLRLRDNGGNRGGQEQERRKPQGLFHRAGHSNTGLEVII
jgi:hypothetical protein